MGLLLVAAAHLSATPVLASRIALDFATTCTVAGESAHCDVEIRNLGDETAVDPELRIEGPERRSQTSKLPSLVAGSSWSTRVELNGDDLPWGRLPLCLRLAYKDGNGYPFSVLSHASLLVGDQLPASLVGTLEPLSLTHRGELNLRVRNLSGVLRNVTARVLLPDEMSLGSGPEAIHIGPGSIVEESYQIDNLAGLAHSTYRVYALLEWEEDGLRQSLFVPGDLAVAGFSPMAESYRRAALGSLFALVTGLCLLQVISGRRRAAQADAVSGSVVTPGDRHPEGKARQQGIVDTLVLAGVFVFLVSYFSPSLMMAPTTPTGGDMASHVYTAAYLEDSLLPQGRILGWMQGNLAGFPLFQLYFPLPFLLMAALSPMIGLPVAFKLVSVLGVFLLPFAAYGAFRYLGYRYPTPALAASLSLPFLMIESNSTWGGNIPSTLAGEFSYSLGVALALILVAASYRGLVVRRHVVANAILLALVGLTHAYALLFAGCVSAAHFFVRPDRRRVVGYLLRMFALAFLLIGFWIVPLLAYSPFSSPYRDIWKIGGWQEVFPPILWPFAALIIVDCGIRFVRHRRAPSETRDPGIGVLANALWISILLYLVAPRLGAVDMRFLPFLQLFLVLIAAIPLGRWLGHAKMSWMLPVLVALTIAGWVETRVRYIPQWIAWNYSGFESKPLWPVFSRVNDYLRGDAGDPRVVFEHTPSHNAAGSIRAFESLPFFSGRSTLEGLYIQSSINTPFIFYAQSEYSEVASCPLPDYHCARLDPDRAAEHLRQFNVRQIIARSDRVKAALRASAEFVVDKELPPYEIFRVLGNEDRYVVPIANEPIFLRSDDWKRDAFRWFKRPGSSDVVLVRAPETGDAPRNGTLHASLPETVQRRPLDATVDVRETIGASDIRIATSRPGHPLLIRISYHPRWRLESGGPVHLASPGFMLIYPENEEERLVFGDPPLVRLGWVMSGGGVLIVLLSLVVPAIMARRTITTGRSAVESSEETRRRPARWILLVPLGAVALGVGLRVQDVRSDGPSLYDRGIERFHQERWSEAQSYFERAVSLAPLSSAAMHSSFYRALAAYKQERWEQAIQLFTEMTALFPDGTYRVEGDYHVGLALRSLGRTEPALEAFRELRERFPDTAWAGFASERIAELESSLAPTPAQVQPDSLPENRS